MKADDDQMARMQAAALASANVDDRRTWAERARRLNMPALIQASRETDRGLGRCGADFTVFSW